MGTMPVGPPMSHRITKESQDTNPRGILVLVININLSVLKASFPLLLYFFLQEALAEEMIARFSLNKVSLN